MRARMCLAVCAAVLALSGCSIIEALQGGGGTAPGHVVDTPCGPVRQFAQIGDFYTPPCPLPDGQPGDIIGTEPIAGAPGGTRAWRVLYLSTQENGEPIAVSGLISVPDSQPPAGGFPLVALLHGTVGGARPCAPSLYPMTAVPGTPVVTLEMFQVVNEAGYAYVAPDYQGLGAPGDAPYLVGRSVAYNSLDGLRAIQRFDEVETTLESVVWGYSQGGHASAWTAQIHAEYAPEQKVLGAVMVAPAAEIESILQRVQATPGAAGLAAAVFVGWGSIYPELHLDDAVPAEQLDAAEQILYNQCGTTALVEVENLSRQHPGGLFALDVADAPWSAIASQNTPGGVDTEIPLAVYQGNADVIVLPSESRLYAQAACAAGNDVYYEIFNGADHVSIVADSAVEFDLFAKDRFAGLPPTSSCDVL